MTTLAQLTIENFKRIKMIELSPDGSTVIIGGHNAQGKSSILDAINVLLWGGKAFPDVPVRKGQKKATIVGVTDDGMTIKRTITEAGTRSLEITNADGMSPKSPQAWLDAKLSEFTCDPLGILRMKPKEQAAELRRIVGVDTTALDAERKEVFEQRTADGRQVKSLQGALEQMDAPADDCPTEVVSAGLLAKRLEDAQGVERSVAQMIRDATSCDEDSAQANNEAATALDNAQEEIDYRNTLIFDLRQRIITAEEEVSEWEKKGAAKAADLKREAVSKKMEADAMRLAADDIEIPDTNAIREQLAAVDETNERVRQAEKYRDVDAQLTAQLATVEAHSTRITQIDEARAALLAKADWPIEGLGIDEGCVTFRGVPLAQASHAEQLRVGVGLALAGNPEIKIALVREGSHLDEESLALLRATAVEAGAQMFIEVVGTHHDGAVLIEDGSVVADGGRGWALC